MKKGGAGNAQSKARNDLSGAFAVINSAETIEQSDVRMASQESEEDTSPVPPRVVKNQSLRQSERKSRAGDPYQLDLTKPLTKFDRNCLDLKDFILKNFRDSEMIDYEQEQQALHNGGAHGAGPVDGKPA